MEWDKKTTKKLTSNLQTCEEKKKELVHKIVIYKPVEKTKINKLFTNLYRKQK